MKTLIALLLTSLVSLNSFAIAFDDLSDPAVKQVTGYTEPNLSAVELFRAEDAIVVKAEFLLSHCMNELTPVTHTVVKTEEELVIILSSLEVKMKKSEDVRCIDTVRAEANVFLPVESQILAKYGDKVRIQIAKTNKVFQVMDKPF